MTAQVIQIRDYWSKRDLERLKAQEETANELLDLAFRGDRDIYESSQGFMAPEKDPA
jgi:hypothetical protein